jgi:hypothetical protein
VQSTQPIVVRVVEEPVQSTSVADVLIGAFGLTAVLVLAALLLGGLLGGALIWLQRVRARRGWAPMPDHSDIRVTPSSSTP